ncbi:MAG: tRNA 2-thiouridine(34) synthase MnmA [Candidatus Omnitrophota bacterium]
MKTVVAMSGGVDSSVAAALLKGQGHEVIGVTMRLDVPDARGRKPECCGTQGIADAKRVSDLLGIPHYVLNFGKEMQEYVIDEFVREYSLGRTPNPCVRCNELVKFEALLNKVSGLGADSLATGHYARIVSSGSKFYLKKSADNKKDQSYFLYRLTQDKLGRIVFPLGEYSKSEVRKMAKKLGLGVAEKEDSQEICFISGSYGEFLRQRLGDRVVPGDIIDQDGNKVGRHRGAVYYTIGQREGLGLARGYPVYVSSIDAEKNVIRIGGKDCLMKKRFLVGNTVFPSGSVEGGGKFSVRIRHLAPEYAGEIILRGQDCEVCLEEKVFAITPGQSAVFYQGDTVAGGGIIQEVYE